MAKKDTLIHVELHEPFNGKKNHYFGCISAIYSSPINEAVNVNVGELYKFCITPDKPYKNKHCTIYRGNVSRKNGNRKPPTKIIHVI